MSKLAISIHALDAQMTKLIDVQQFDDAEAVVPLNDARTAKFTVSVYDDAAQYAREPLKHYVKVLFEDQMPFFGPMITPQWDGTEGKVTINAHDQTLRLKRHFIRLSDAACADGYLIDGSLQGAWLLVAAAEVDDPDLIAAGVPPLGIAFGADVTATSTAKRKAERGAQCWEQLTNILQAAEGMDLEFRPVDAEHDPDGVHGDWIVAEYIARTKQGVDRTRGSDPAQRNGQPVIFQYGFGFDNLDDYQWDPDGDAIVNRAIAVSPGEGDDDHRATARVLASMVENGIYEAWDSSGGTEDLPDQLVTDVLRTRARALVGAYGYPPNYITIQPALDRGPQGEDTRTPPRPFKDYDVGDRITADCKKGYMVLYQDARIVKATLRQASQAKDVTCNLECVPVVVGSDSDIGDGAGDGGF